MPKEITPLYELQVKEIKPKVKADGTLVVLIWTVRKIANLLARK